MATDLTPYLHFRGDARTAMERYRSVFGGELTVSSFADFGANDVPESERDWVMHAQLTTPGGLTLMAADTPSHMEFSRGTDVSISLSGDDEIELTRFWDGLADGATIDQPLVKAPWGDTFGMLHDRFGVSWMVNITGAAA